MEEEEEETNEYYCNIRPDLSECGCCDICNKEESESEDSSE